MRGPNGIIYVSNMTTNYELNEICTWNVTVRSGRTISVKIIAMKLSDDNSCSYSYALVSIFRTTYEYNLFLKKMVMKWVHLFLLQ